MKRAWPSVPAIAAVTCALIASSARAQPLAIPVEREALAGAIAGRACLDRDGDGRCAPDEPGFADLRLVLETGQEVVTDSQGRYHLARIAAREPRGAPLRLEPGRHRLAADARQLPPGSRIQPEAASIEVPMAGLVLQDFAVQTPPARSVTPLEGPPADAPPSARLEAGGGVRFTLTGQAAPGDRVLVRGGPAEVDASGRFRAEVALVPGPNDVELRLDSASAIQLYAQRIDVVPRPSGALVVPRAPRLVATIYLPSGSAGAAAAGTSRLRVESAPGAAIVHPGGRVQASADGAADVPIVLSPGANALPLSIEREGEPPRRIEVQIAARAQPLIVGLLDVEIGLPLGAAPDGRVPRVLGRGAAHAEVPVGAWMIEGEVDLRDQDVDSVRAYGARALASPRSVGHLERALDPDRAPSTFGDDSTSIVPNAPEGRFRIEARHPSHGRAGFGTHRATFADAETGRYHRELFGAYAAFGSDPKANLSARAEAFASAGNVDPSTGLHTAPAHAEFLATGGSLFYLPHPAVARGSERVRVVVRDGLTRVPIAEEHLVRGVDYDLDATSGRIVLAKPLSFVAGPGALWTGAPSDAAEPVLVVDYERLALTGEPRGASGGRAAVRLGPLALSAGAAQEAQGEARYRLFRASAGATLGSLLMSLDAATSEGAAHEAGDVTLSEDGGLGFLSPGAGDAARNGWALTARLRGPTPGGGRLDASWRRRTDGYSDSERDGDGALTQLSAFGEQPIGPFALGAIADVRTAADPRLPFEDRRISTRLLAGYVAYRRSAWDVRLEAQDRDLAEDVDAIEGPTVRGGRTSLGAAARYRVNERLSVLAGHRQTLATRGDGAGALDDTFSSAGAEVAVEPGAKVGVHGGWGPTLGPLAWLTAEVGRGPETFYGSYSVDVDGPDVGERRAVTGARTRVSDGTVVFVEDVGAHDATAVRNARAVGLSVEALSGFQVSARYERGARHVLDAPAPLRRDAGGVSAAFLRPGVRLYARAEARYDRGHGLFAATGSVDRLQRLVGAAASVDVATSLQVSSRLHWSDTLVAGAAQAALLEASAGAAFRWRPLIVLLHYGIERELSAARAAWGGRTLSRLSLMPSLRIGDRFALAAGGHAGWSWIDGARALVLSGSLRPSVKVLGSFEVAAEYARRSAAPDGDALDAVRGEVGYRFGPDLMLAAGYHVFGFQGLGLSPDEAERDRLYLRAEATW